MSYAIDQSNNIMDPFAVPDVVLKRMELNEFLDLLRPMLNKGYMPTATGERSYNSKPEYVLHRDVQYPEFPRVSSYGLCNGACCYTFDTYHVFVKDPPIFLGVRFEPYHILTNLRTCQTLIRLTTPVDALWWEWRENEGRTISLNRHELQDVLETYI